MLAILERSQLTLIMLNTDIKLINFELVKMSVAAICPIL
jgi:hypothetical protein